MGRMDGPREPTTLVTALLEIERHVRASGWDRPPQLYALVGTADLAAQEPTLAEQLGLDGSAPADGLTPVEQEPLPQGPLDDALASIEWSSSVRGCALVHEVVALPPRAEEEMPRDADPGTYAAGHPLRRDLRLAVAVLRDGSRAAAVRVRDGDNPDPDTPDGSLIVDSDLAPALVAALLATLQ